jgi:hypothetical protein
MHFESFGVIENVSISGNGTRAVKQFLQNQYTGLILRTLGSANVL